MKNCKNCTYDLPDDKFYKNHAVCKYCYNNKRKKQNNTFVNKLGYDKLKNIIDDLQQGQLNKLQIAKKYEIPKTTFYTWINNGELIYQK